MPSPWAMRPESDRKSSSRPLRTRKLRSKARMLVIGDLRRLELATEIVSSPLALRTRSPTRRRPASTTAPSTCWTSLHSRRTLPGASSPPRPDTAPTSSSKRPSQLAMDHQVDAICTGPLNKAALHAAGHKYPGHTELLAALTGHRGSVHDADRAEDARHPRDHPHRPDRRDRQDQRRPGLPDHQARLRPAASPPASRTRASPCAPSTLTPAKTGCSATARKRRRSSRASRRPAPTASTRSARCPADTLFFLAGRGDFDLVVAQYHDQGHGPVKVLGLENGVNITVGPARGAHLRGPRHRLRHRRQEHRRPRVAAGSTAAGGGPRTRAQRGSIGSVGERKTSKGRNRPAPARTARQR